MIPGFSLNPPLGSAEAITFIGTATNNALSTSLNFNSVSIGAAAGDRRVILAIHTHQGSILTATIGGVAATIHVFSANPDFCDTTIVSAIVPTGTTANINITKNNVGSGRTVLGVFRMLGNTDIPADTDAVASLSAGGSTSLVFSPTGFTGISAITVVTGSLGLIWSGATEAYDFDSPGTNDLRVSAAIVQPNAAGVTATKGFPYEDAMAGAVWS